MFRSVLFALASLILCATKSMAQDQWFIPGYAGRPSDLKFSEGIYWSFDTSRGSVLTSHDGVSWKGVPVMNEISAAAYGNGIFVVASDTMASSTDGINWTVLPIEKPVWHLAYGNGVFVGASTTGNVIVSGNGMLWSSVSLPVQYDVESLGFAGGRFIMVTPKGVLFHSTDGRNWTTATPPVKRTIPFNDGSLFAYGNGTWLTSFRFMSYLLRSTDGIAWEWSATTGLPSSPELHSLLFVGGLFYALTDEGDIFTSSTGLAWSQIHSADGDESPFFSMTHNGERFVAYDIKDRCLTSMDAVSWETEASLFPTSELLLNTTFDGTRLVGLFNEYDGRVAALEPEGTWTELSNFADADWPPLLLHHDGSRFLTIFDNYYFFRLSQSEDGVAWSAINPEGDDNSTKLSLIHDGGRYVTTGTGGLIKISDDAATWTVVRPYIYGSGRDLPTLGYFNGLYIAAGDKGLLLTSPNATDWTARASGSSDNITGFASGNSKACLLSGRTVLVSTNGTTWTSHVLPIGTSAEGTSIAYGNGMFVVTSSEGKVLVSTTGASWNVAYSMPNRMYFRALNYGGGVFAAGLGYRGSVISAPSVPVIRGANRISVKLKQSFSVTLKTTGEGAVLSAEKPLPTGLKLSGNVLSGQATFIGKKILWLKAVNSVGTGTKRILLESKDATPPLLQLVPNVTSILTNKSRVPLKGWASDNVLPVAVKYRIKRGLIVKTGSAILRKTTASRKPWSLSLPLPSQGTWTVTLWAEDAAGNKSTARQLRIKRS